MTLRLAALGLLAAFTLALSGHEAAIYGGVAALGLFVGLGITKRLRRRRRR